MTEQKTVGGARRWPMRVLAGASLLATVGIVWLGVTASSDMPQWARLGLASSLSLKCLAVMAVGVTALAALCLALLARRGRRPAPVGAFHGDQSGSAALEMTLVFPFALIIFLIVIQSAVLFNANMVVHYSAFAGARMATVVVPMEIGLEGNNLVWPPDVQSSNKLERIRQAAVVALIPVSASLPAGGGSVMGTDIQKGTAAAFSHMGAAAPDWLNHVSPQYDYADKYTQIDLQKPGHWMNGNPDSDCPYGLTRPNLNDWTNWGWAQIPYCPFYHSVPMIWDFWYWEDLHVKVTYQFLLQIPYAARFLGDPVSIPGLSGNQYATNIVVTVALTNEGGPEIRPLDYVQP